MRRLETAINDWMKYKESVEAIRAKNLASMSAVTPEEKRVVLMGVQPQ